MSELEVSFGPADTVGALLSGWEFLDARSVGGLGSDVQVTGLANMPPDPIITGIAPQSGGLLFNLVAQLLPVPDTLSDRTVNIFISALPDKTNFSDPSGNTLTYGWTSGSVTILPPSCCDTPGDADNSGAFNIADVTFGIARIFSAGEAPACADEADANGDNTFNIADITYGIAHIFSGGPAPICGTTGE